MSDGSVHWDIRNEGRAWDKDEFWARLELRPPKLEIAKGRLLGSQQDRETLLCLLLENIGADRVVELGDPEVWRAAVAKLPSSTP
jgi:hypothetical protein